MALQVQTFLDFNSAKWQNFIAKIKEDTGTEITSTAGTVKHGSFEFSYAYNEQANVLILTVLRKPLFINSHTILQGVAEEIANLPSTLPPAPTI